MTNEQRDRYLGALRRELDGYLKSGSDDRAAEVEAEIARVTGTQQPQRPPVRQATRRPRGSGKTTRS